MSHFTCPGCGVTIADRTGAHLERTCPRCFLHRGLVVQMERRVLETRFASAGLLDEVAEVHAELTRTRAAAAEASSRLASASRQRLT